MLKYLLVIGVIAFVYYFFIKKKPIQTTTRTQETTTQSDEMVQCQTCEVYCEISEAILSNGKYYCSQECLKSAK